MVELNVMDVYNKIKEIRKSRKIDKQNPISIESIVQAVDGDKEIVEEYIRALTILELIKPTEVGYIVLVN